MAIFPKLITHVPVEAERDGTLTAAGVGVWFRNVGLLPDTLYWEIEDALKAKVAADGVNMPVALSAGVWLMLARSVGRRGLRATIIAPVLAGQTTR